MQWLLAFTGLVVFGNLVYRSVGHEIKIDKKDILNVLLFILCFVPFILWGRSLGKTYYVLPFFVLVVQGYSYFLFGKDFRKQAFSQGVWAVSVFMMATMLFRASDKMEKRKIQDQNNAMEKRIMNE